MAKIDYLVTSEDQKPASPEYFDVCGVDASGSLTDDTIYYGWKNEAWIELPYTPGYGLYIYDGTTWNRVTNHDVDIDRFIKEVEVVVDPDGQPPGTYIMFVFATTGDDEIIYYKIDVPVYTAGNGLSLTIGGEFSVKTVAGSHLTSTASGVGFESGFEAANNSQTVTISSDGSPFTEGSTTLTISNWILNFANRINGLFAKRASHYIYTNPTMSDGAGMIAVEFEQGFDLPSTEIPQIPLIRPIACFGSSADDINIEKKIGTWTYQALPSSNSAASDNYPANMLPWLNATTSGFFGCIIDNYKTAVNSSTPTQYVLHQRLTIVLVQQGYEGDLPAWIDCAWTRNYFSATDTWSAWRDPVY
jgi:hypothetical protein